jgi:hypothetical protein
MIPVIASGVSAAKVVAAMLTPAHQGVLLLAEGDAAEIEFVSFHLLLVDFDEVESFFARTPFLGVPGKFGGGY